MLTRLRPRVGTVVAVTAATVFTLMPAVLPRTSATQAVVTGVLAMLAIGIAGMIRIPLGRRGIDIEARFGHHLVPVLLVCGFAITAATVNATHWQNGLRAAMGSAPIGPEYWLRAAVGAALSAGLLVGLLRGLRWVKRRIGRALRARRISPAETPPLLDNPADAASLIQPTPKATAAAAAEPSP